MAISSGVPRELRTVEWEETERSVRELLERYGRQGSGPAPIIRSLLCIMRGCELAGASGQLREVLFATAKQRHDALASQR